MHVHAMSERVPQWRPRRSGKTTEIVREATELYEDGAQVLIIYPRFGQFSSVYNVTHLPVVHLPQNCFAVMSQSRDKLSGRTEIRVFTDEVCPRDFILFVKPWLEPAHFFVMGYYTDDI